MSATRRIVAVVVLAIGVVVGTASSASAHAVLLRTEPSPQTTVPTSPTEVRLFFSERVETGLGAIRVFDVDGKRVDESKLKRSADHREVAVAVPHLADGTYTVTWKAVSADGHPVRGGFTFYVVAPSTISAVAISPDEGPSTWVKYGGGTARFLWFSAFFALVGMAVVRVLVWTPAIRATGETGSEVAAGFRRRFRIALPSAWVLLVLAGFALLPFEAASLAGRFTALSSTLDTTFGHLWSVQMVLSMALGIPVYALCRRRRIGRISPAVWLVVGGLLCVGLAFVVGLNGHARTNRAPNVAVTSITVHLLAAATWIGGLGALVLLAGPGWRRQLPERRSALLAQLVRRFSRVAIAAVLVVVATGTINSLADFGSLSDLWTVGYGRIVLLKIVLLVIALAIASRHLFVVPKRLANPGGDEPVRSFEWSSGIELGVLTLAVGLAAALVAMVPGRSLALAGQGQVNKESRAGDYTVQLFIDPSRVGDNEIHATYVNSQGLAAAGVTNLTLTLSGPGTTPERPVEMRYLSPGHFAGDTTLPATGTYRANVSAPQGSTTFTFTIRKGAST